MIESIHRARKNSMFFITRFSWETCTKPGRESRRHRIEDQTWTITTVVFADIPNGLRRIDNFLKKPSVQNETRKEKILYPKFKHLFNFSLLLKMMPINILEMFKVFNTGHQIQVSYPYLCNSIDRESWVNIHYLLDYEIRLQIQGTPWYMLNLKYYIALIHFILNENRQIL